MKTSNRKYYESFNVKRKLQTYEKLFIGLESVIFVVMSFYAGFEFSRSKNLLWLCLFIGIILGKFKWQQIKETTKRIVL